MHLALLRPVQENEPNRFCVLLTFWTSAKDKATENGVKQQRLMVSLIRAGPEKNVVKKFMHTCLMFFFFVPKTDI